MTRWKAVPLAILVIFPGLVLAAAQLPPGVKIEAVGKEPVAFEEGEGVSVAKSPLKISVAIPPEARTIVVTACAGNDKAGFNAVFKWEDKSSTHMPVRAMDETLSDGKVLPDCVLKLPWNVKHFIRPDMKYYKPDQRAKVFADWQKLPAASGHFLRLELRRMANGAQLWADGRFINELPQKVAPVQLELTLSAGAAVKEIAWDVGQDSAFLPMPLEHFSRVENPAIGGLSLRTGRAVIEGIPFKVASISERIEVAGLGRLSCPSDDLVSFYWSRSSLNALPEARIVSVPLDTYAFVHVLCAAEEHASKVPEFTVRLTRYGTGRGDGMADSVVRIPAGETPHDNAKKVGTVQFRKDKTANIWLIRVPLKNGLIQDLLREDERKRISPRLPTSNYLDIEILDPLAGVDANDTFPPIMTPTERSYVPRGPASSAHVFGLTLERSPAELTVTSNQAVNMFYASDKPELLAKVNVRENGRFTVSWEFADAEGAITASGKSDVVFNDGKTADTVRVPVDAGYGWYATRFRLLDSAGRELVDHRASFVMLPPDTRKAGFESPHGAWWFNWAHGGEKNIERVGPVLQRAGLRHTILGKDLPESATAPYKVTSWCIFWKPPTKVTVDEWLPQFEAHIRETLAAYPNCLKTVMLFHESGSYDAPFPSEIWGEKPPPIKPENDEKWKFRMTYVFPLVKMIREKFPELKIQIGNDGDGTRIVAELLRRGLSPKDYDYVAVEDLGQTFFPEKPALGAMQSAWFLRQTARKLGNPGAQITGCYEWLGRRNVALGLASQAEWYIRDALQARAYGFHSIAIGTVHDAGMGYFHTIWGAGGLCYRYPYMYPKPSYAAMATLTRVLDTAKFERAVPGNSLSVYALEFKRGDEWIYAFWAPRGYREVKLMFDGEAETLVTDLYGREKASKGREQILNVNTAAQYVTSRIRIGAFTAGKSWFPRDEEPKSTAAVEKLESAASVTVAEIKHLEQKSGTNFPHRTKGDFELRDVIDADKGKCLEIELKPKGQVWEMLHEHVALKLKNPVVSTHSCEYAGVWVKGNSGWGDIMFEVADSNNAGRILTPDWMASTSINFDGWCFVRMKLPTGPNWRGPVKILGVIVSVPRQMLYATEFVPVGDLKVRLKSISLF